MTKSIMSLTLYAGRRQSDDEGPGSENLTSVVDLQTLVDRQQGMLGVAECGVQVPFAVRRVFYLTDLPSGATRGGHAHLKLEQFFICLSGGVRIGAADRSGDREIVLRSAGKGLYIPPMTWIDIDVLIENTVCVVLASELYDEDDYLRDKGDFQSQLSKVFEND